MHKIVYLGHSFIFCSCLSERSILFLKTFNMWSEEVQVKERNKSLISTASDHILKAFINSCLMQIEHFESTPDRIIFLVCHKLLKKQATPA